MQSDYVFVLAIIFSILVFWYQRTEQKSRRAVFFGMLIIGGIVFGNFATRRDLVGEAVTGLVIALVLNFLFWVLIGRYNPVGSSDSIKVLGMDD